MEIKGIISGMERLAGSITASDYITAHTLDKAMRSVEEAKRIVEREMPNGNFVFKGLDSFDIYFNVVAKMSRITVEEIVGLVAKSRFEPVRESRSPIYIGEFKMRIM